MPQDPFWHPVMGAVDMLTKETMRKRELYQRAQQQMALREEERQHQITVRDEEREYGRKKAGFTARMGYLDELEKDSTIIDDSKRDIGQARLKMIGEMEAGAPVSDVEIPDVTRRTMKLPPDIAKEFEGLGIDMNQPMPIKVAKSLIDQVHAQRKEQRAGEASEADIKYKEAMTEKAKKWRPAGARPKPGDKTKTITALVEKLRKEAVKDLEFEGRDPKYEGDPQKIERAEGYIDFLDDILLRAERGEDIDTLLDELQTYGEFLMEGEEEPEIEEKKRSGYLESILNIMRGPIRRKKPKGRKGKFKPEEVVKQPLTY